MPEEARVIDAAEAKVVAKEDPVKVIPENDVTDDREDEGGEREQYPQVRISRLRDDAQRRPVVQKEQAQNHQECDPPANGRRCDQWCQVAHNRRLLPPHDHSRAATV